MRFISLLGTAAAGNTGEQTPPGNRVNLRKGRYLSDVHPYLRAVYSDHTFTLPADAPTAFVNARWGKLVLTFHGIDRRFYEICVLAVLKNALRSGDIWVQGSRQFKAFDEYLLPAERFEAQQQASALADTKL